jgi:uncharacterized membrane protein YhiD involved in acid resistance
VDLIVLQQVAVAFGIGLLLGLQRERTESSIGGIRTFPLIALSEQGANAVPHSSTSSRAALTMGTGV